MFILVDENSLSFKYFRQCMPIIFTDNREKALAMNIVAQAAFVYDQCTELHVQGSYLRWQQEGFYFCAMAF